MILSDKAIEMICRNDEVKMAIAKATGRSFRTVDNWIRDNDSLLTLAASIKVISELTGLTESQILEDKITA